MPTTLCTDPCVLVGPLVRVLAHMSPLLHQASPAPPGRSVRSGVTEASKGTCEVMSCCDCQGRLYDDWCHGGRGEGRSPASSVVNVLPPAKRVISFFFDIAILQLQYMYITSHSCTKLSFQIVERRPFVACLCQSLIYFIYDVFVLWRYFGVSN